MKQLANPIRLTYGYAYTVAFMPDGKMLMIGTHGGALLWDFHRRRTVRDYYQYAHPAEHIAVTPDGLTLVTGSADSGQALVWNISDAAVLHRISADTQGLWWMAVSPCGRKLLTCGKKGGLRCWDMRTGEQTLFVPVRTDKAWRAAWSPCGRWIAHSSGTRRVRVVAADSGATVLRIDAPCKEVASIAFHPDGRLFTGLRNGTIQVWDVTKGHWKEEIACRNTAVDDILFSRDGQLMLEHGPDKWPNVHVTDLHTGQRIQCQRYDSDEEQRNVDLSPDGQWWAGVCYGFEVGVFKTGKTGEHRVLADDFDYLYSAQFTPDGKSVLVGNHKSGESLYRAGDGTRLWSRRKRESYGQVWAISPDGRWMVSGMEDGNIIVRDMKDGRVVAKSMVHSRQVLGVTFLASGNRIVTTGHEGTMAVLQFSQPKGEGQGSVALMRRLGLGCMNDAKLTSDGKTLLTASPLGIQVWDAASEKLVHNLSSQNGEADRIFLSPDNRFAVGLFEHYYTVDTALVWDLDSGKRLCRIRGGAVWNYASFSADGLVFCLCGYKKEQQEYRQVVQARVTQTGRLLWTTQLKEGARPSVVITLDGSKAVLLYCREKRHRCGKDGPRWRRYRKEYAPCVRVFDTRTGREMIQYRQDLPAAAKYPSVLSGGAAPFFLSVENGETRLRNALDATVETRLSFHPGYAENAQLSPDGKYVCLDTSDLSLWDTEADNLVNAPSPEALADPSKSTPHWHGKHGTEYVCIKDLVLRTTRTYNLGHYYQSTKAFRLPDGERVLLAGDEHYALWNPNRDKPDWITWCASQLNTSEIRAGEICASPDSSVIALGLRDKSGVFLLDAKTGVILTVIDTPAPVSSLAFTPDGTCVMAAFETLGIRVWNAATGGEVMAVSIDDGTLVYESRYTPDAKRMLAYCRREGAVPANTIRILDAQDGTLLAELPGECNSFALGNPISPDGARLLTEESSTVYLWDISGL